MLTQQNVSGKSSSAVYAVALLASDQSSTITGTYAGQYIMQIRISISLKYKFQLMILKFQPA